MPQPGHLSHPALPGVGALIIPIPGRSVDTAGRPWDPRRRCACHTARPGPGRARSGRRLVCAPKLRLQSPRTPGRGWLGQGRSTARGGLPDWAESSSLGRRAGLAKQGARARSRPVLRPVKRTRLGPGIRAPFPLPPGGSKAREVKISCGMSWPARTQLGRGLRCAIKPCPHVPQNRRAGSPGSTARHSVAFPLKASSTDQPRIAGRS